MGTRPMKVHQPADLDATPMKGDAPGHGHRRSAPVNHMLFVLWVLMVLGPPRLGSNREVMASVQGNIDTSTLPELAVWGAAACYLSVHVIAEGLAFFAGLPGGISAFLTFGVFAVLTALWSPGPLFTIYMGGKIIVATGMAWAVQRHTSDDMRLVRWTAYGCVIQLAILMVVALVSPQTVMRAHVSERILGSRFGGTGFLAVVAITFFLWSMETGSRRRPVAWMALALGVPSLFLAMTRSTFAAAAAVLLLYAWYRRKLLAAAGAAACVVVFLGQDTIVEAMIHYARLRSGSMRTLSARLDLWPYLWNAVVKDGGLLSGLGYASAERQISLEWGQLSGHPRMAGSHGALLSVLVGTGLVGAAFFGWTMVRSARDAATLVLGGSGREGDRFALAAFWIAVLAVSVVGTGVLSGPSMLLFVAASIAAGSGAFASGHSSSRQRSSKGTLRQQ